LLRDDQTRLQPDPAASFGVGERPEDVVRAAHLMYLRKDLAGARSRLEALLTRHPNHADAQHLLAEIAAKQAAASGSLRDASTSGEMCLSGSRDTVTWLLYGAAAAAALCAAWLLIDGAIYALQGGMAARVPESDPANAVGQFCSQASRLFSRRRRYYESSWVGPIDLFFIGAFSAVLAGWLFRQAHARDTSREEHPR
jgi:hypothetical protein